MACILWSSVPVSTLADLISLITSFASKWPGLSYFNLLSTMSAVIMIFWKVRDCQIVRESLHIEIEKFMELKCHSNFKVKILTWSKKCYFSEFQWYHFWKAPHMELWIKHKYEVVVQDDLIFRFQMISLFLVLDLPQPASMSSPPTWVELHPVSLGSSQDLLKTSRYRSTLFLPLSWRKHFRHHFNNLRLLILMMQSFLVINLH